MTDLYRDKLCPDKADLAARLRSVRNELTEILADLGDGEPAKRFVPPTLEEWLAYGDTLCPPYPHKDAAGAWNHYEAKGWMIGKSKCKQWKAALRTCYNRWKPALPGSSKSREQILWEVSR